MSPRGPSASGWRPPAVKVRPPCLRGPSPGHPPKLGLDQLRLVPDFLSHGAEAYGFRGEVWTCTRVAKVIQEEFGVSYHPGHVSRLLKELHWTPQLPIAGPSSTTRREIEQWRVEVWPRLKAEARREHRALVFVDESGFYLLPGKVRTYAPRAHAGPPRVADARPPLGHGGCHAGGQDLHPDASGGAQRVAHHRVPQAPDPACRISTLGNLGRVAHPSPRRSRGVPCQRHGTWPSRRAVAAVCPGLESRRSAWQHLKHVEMRNLVCLDVEELHLELHLAVGRLRQKPRVIRSFFVGAGLEAENFSSLRNAL